MQRREAMGKEELERKKGRREGGLGEGKTRRRESKKELNKVRTVLLYCTYETSFPGKIIHLMSNKLQADRCICEGKACSELEIR